MAAMNPPITGVMSQITEIRNALTEFAKPLNHYKADVCLELLGKVSKAVEGISDPAGRWNNFKLAVNQTLAQVSMCAYDLSHYSHETNLPERAAWLKMEFAAAIQEPFNHQDLLRARELLIIGERGVSKLLDLNALKARRLYSTGSVRKELRELDHDLAVVLKEFSQMSHEDIRVRFMDRKNHIFTHILMCRLNIDELKRKLYPEVNERTGAKLKLSPEAQAKLDHINALTSKFDEFYKLNLHLYGRTKEEYLTFFKECKQRTATLEQEFRIVFSSELSYKLTPEQHRQVNISKESGIPDPATIDEIRSAMSEWLIDPDLGVPQKGFGRPYTEQEISDFFTKYKADLYRIKINGVTAGFYMLFTDERNFPPYVNGILNQLSEAGEYSRVLKGWTETVFKTKAAGQLEKDTGINVYDLLHDAVCDTFAAETKERVYATVREGDNANTAKAAHLRRGWEETGVFVKLGKFDYQIIRLVLSPGGLWG